MKIADKGYTFYEKSDDHWAVHLNVGWHIAYEEATHIAFRPTKKEAMTEIRKAQPCNCVDCAKEIARFKKGNK